MPPGCRLTRLKSLDMGEPELEVVVVVVLVTLRPFSSTVVWITTVGSDLPLVLFWKSWGLKVPESLESVLEDW